MGITITPEIMAALYEGIRRNEALNKGDPMDAAFTTIFTQIPVILEGRGDPEKSPVAVWNAMNVIKVHCLDALYSFRKPTIITTAEIEIVTAALTERGFIVSGTEIKGVAPFEHPPSVFRSNRTKSQKNPTP